LGALKKNMGSNNYQRFHDYVFGDYRYYHYNGLSEDIFISLDEPDRIKAEKLVLKALRRRTNQERVIRAAGNLKLQPAVPLLEKRLKGKWFLSNKSFRSSIKWSLLKIQGDKASLGVLIDVLGNKTILEDLSRVDAANLLSDFGDDSSVVLALLQEFLDEDIAVCQSSSSALRKIFQKDPYVQNMLGGRSIAASSSERSSIVEYIKGYLGIN
jgi:hypothetical protein